MELLARSIVAAIHGEGVNTLIGVAHRILTLRGADRIVVLEHGRITAEGAYDELLATSATFRTLAGVDG